MEDDLLRIEVEKLLVEAEDCELISKLATDPQKRELFKKLALTFAAWRTILKPSLRAQRLRANKAAPDESPFARDTACRGFHELIALATAVATKLSRRNQIPMDWFAHGGEKSSCARNAPRSTR